MHKPSNDAAPQGTRPDKRDSEFLFLTVIFPSRPFFIDLCPFIPSSIFHLPSPHCLGAGTDSTIPFSTSSIDCPPIATSGASCTRCRSTGSEAALMSSGITK